MIQFKANEVTKEALAGKGLVLVDFWAVWCGPCRMIAPFVEQLAEEYADKLTVGKLNVDEETDAAIRYNVSSIPTLVLFRDGEEIDRMLGAVPYERLKAFVDRNLE